MQQPTDKNTMQRLVISNLNLYLQQNDLSLEINKGGICNGLAILHAQAVLDGKEEEFKDILAMIAGDKIDAEDYDAKVVTFINHVLVAYRPELSHDYEYSQRTAHELFAAKGKPLQSVYTLGGNATKQEWANRFDSMNIAEDEVILAGNTRHAISIVKHGGQYRVYDPNANNVSKSFDNSSDMVAWISESAFAYEGDVVGFSLNVISPNIKNDTANRFPDKSVLVDLESFSQQAVTRHAPEPLSSLNFADVDTIKIAIEKGKISPEMLHETFQFALLTRQNGVVDYLFDHILQDEYTQEHLLDYYSSAATAGNEHAFMMLAQSEKTSLEEFYYFDVLCEACEGGNPALLTSMIEYLNKKEDGFSKTLESTLNAESRLVEKTLKSNNPEMLTTLMSLEQFKQQSFNDTQKKEILTAAIKMNNPAMLESVFEHFNPSKELLSEVHPGIELGVTEKDIILQCIEGNHRNSLAHELEKDVQLTEDKMMSYLITATRSGNPEIMQTLLQSSRINIDTWSEKDRKTLVSAVLGSSNPSAVDIFINNSPSLKDAYSPEALALFCLQIGADSVQAGLDNGLFTAELLKIYPLDKVEKKISESGEKIDPQLFLLYDKLGINIDSKFLIDNLQDLPAEMLPQALVEAFKSNDKALIEKVYETHLEDNTLNFDAVSYDLYALNKLSPEVLNLLQEKGMEFSPKEKTLIKKKNKQKVGFLDSLGVSVGLFSDFIKGLTKSGSRIHYNTDLEITRNTQGPLSNNVEPSVQEEQAPKKHKKIEFAEDDDYDDYDDDYDGLNAISEDNAPPVQHEKTKDQVLDEQQNKTAITQEERVQQLVAPKPLNPKVKMNQGAVDSACSKVNDEDLKKFMQLCNKLAGDSKFLNKPFGHVLRSSKEINAIDFTNNEQSVEAAIKLVLKMMCKKNDNPDDFAQTEAIVKLITVYNDPSDKELPESIKKAIAEILDTKEEALSPAHFLENQKDLSEMTLKGVENQAEHDLRLGGG